MGFPPHPVYPLALDDETTLFQVYNTTESRTVYDNEPWSEIIQIIPVGADELEIWAENGFATIEGELFYYDSVEKDENGKIYKLKGCARNLHGEHTRWNPAGTWVRAFVVAEHHNQLVDTVTAIQTFVLDLTDRVKELYDEPECGDDFDCASVNLAFDINEGSPCDDTEGLSNPCEGTVVDYRVSIQGKYTSFLIEFGDGNSSTDLEGRYVYPPNTEILPVVTVGNDKCTVVQSTGAPIATPTETAVPTVPEPAIPDLPDIICPDCAELDVKFNFPPIVFPCMELGDISIPAWDVHIPSIIEVSIPPIPVPSFIFTFSIIFPEVDPFPSVISIIDPNIPSVIIMVDPPIIPSIIEFGEISIPSAIEIIGCAIPSVIEFGTVSIPTMIEFGEISIPSIIDFGNVNIPTIIQFGDVNIVSIIEFGDVNIVSIIEFGDVYLPEIIQFGPVTIPETIGFGALYIPSMIEFGPVNIPEVIEFGSVYITSTITLVGTVISTISVVANIISVITVSWAPAPSLECVVRISCPSEGAFRMNENDEEFKDSFGADTITANLGIPSVIEIVAPHLPSIKVEHSLPLKIEVESPYIPDTIEFTGMDYPMPSQITIVQESPIPQSIIVLASGLPSMIELKLNTADIPMAIPLIPSPELPTAILLDGTNIPSVIQVKGIPDTIEIKHNIPTHIVLSAPENFTVPLTYIGGPVPVQFDIKNLTGEDGTEAPCFALVPCSKK